MRIAFVNSTHQWGGVKTWTLGLTRGLLERGHTIHLFLRQRDPFAEACRDAGLEVHEMSFGPDWNPLAIVALKKGLREHGCQILVTNVSKDNRIGGPAARALGIPVLMRVGGPGDITDRFKVRLEQDTWVDHIVTPAEAVRDGLLRFAWMRASDRVTVIPNGVDVHRFSPGANRGVLRGIIGVPHEAPVLATTSQLTEIKRHDLLFSVFAALPTTDPLPHLVLVGRGDQEARLRSLTDSLGLADRIHFLGFREDLPVLLEDVDIALQHSDQEGLPNSVLEFMAMGKAILATDVGGTSEAIEDEMTGLLVPANDPQRWQQSLERLLQEPDLRKSLGAAARERAETSFSLEVMQDRMEALLETLIDA